MLPQIRCKCGNSFYVVYISTYVTIHAPSVYCVLLSTYKSTTKVSFVFEIKDIGFRSMHSVSQTFTHDMWVLPLL